MKLFCTRLDTPLGPMALAACDAGLAGAWFLGQQHMPDMAQWQPCPDHPLLIAAGRQLDEYFVGGRREFALVLSPAWGSDFQRKVWRALGGIPYGRTSCYGELARGLGRPSAARAVGTAVGRNPWSVIVPCHRMLGADGSLTGYAGGLERKAALLRLEGVAA